MALKWLALPVWGGSRVALDHNQLNQLRTIYSCSPVAVTTWREVARVGERRDRPVRPPTTPPCNPGHLARNMARWCSRLNSCRVQGRVYGTMKPCPKNRSCRKYQHCRNRNQAPLARHKTVWATNCPTWPHYITGTENPRKHAQK